MKRYLKQMISGLIIISMGIFLMPMSISAEAENSETGITESE
jgi:multisubunit Na+/H+ antiporter MnhC subunit